MAITIFAVDRYISWSTSDDIYTDIEQLPDYDVALVLGTSKYLGKILNDYYTNRINAAIQLFTDGKVNAFLMSGDNAHRSYNEPWTMKRDLLKAGVPEESIHLDYAGFRTLDSIVRSKEIFDADEFIIVTQKFHCERALFIARHYNIHAVCLAVPGPSQQSGIQVRIREVFARVKAILDLYILETKPKFLGPKEPINQQ
ncbi:vancomycin high temperature exclusion protein [Vibrio sp. HN007]|uniref:SanA/YdcF family protein n=1 Tax=Vibrio iocasae TaxID=3098914 RepID=UPI0035D440BE